MRSYYAPTTRAERSVWLFNELDLPYAFETLAVGDRKMRTPDYRVTFNSLV